MKWGSHSGSQTPPWYYFSHSLENSVQCIISSLVRISVHKLAIFIFVKCIWAYPVSTLYYLPLCDLQRVRTPGYRITMYTHQVRRSLYPGVLWFMRCPVLQFVVPHWDDVYENCWYTEHLMLSISCWLWLANFSLLPDCKCSPEFTCWSSMRE